LPELLQALVWQTGGGYFDYMTTSDHLGLLLIQGIEKSIHAYQKRQEGFLKALTALQEPFYIFNFSPIGMIGFEPTTPASRKWGAHKALIYSQQDFGTLSLSGRCSQRCNAPLNEG
jgi:hypothetical protein